MTAEKPSETKNDDFGSVTRAAMPDDFVTRLLLLRHGEVEGMGAREVRGQRDVPLSEHGRAQHRQLATLSAGNAQRPTRLISSDLSRCRHLAELISEHHELTLELEPALREQHMGDWQGRTWDDISAAEGTRINDYWDDYWNAAPPGGESMAELDQRLWDWWQRVEPTLRGEHVAIVTHAGPIRALLSRFMGLPGTESLRFAPPAATATQVAYSAAGFVLEGLGLTGSSAPAPNPSKPTLTKTTANGSRPLRIALTGSAGTGKTTLGHAIADELGLPFIEEGMRVRLEGGMDPHALDHEGFLRLNKELWEEHRDLERAHPNGFVSDRSSLDFAAFRLHYSIYEDVAEADAFFDTAIRWAEHYSHVFLFPHGVLPLINDGIRGTNPWMQLRFQLCVEGLLDRHLRPDQLFRVPETTDLADRLAWARATLPG